MEKSNESIDDIFDELQKISNELDFEHALQAIIEQSIVELKQVEMQPIYDEYYGSVVFTEIAEKGAKKPVLRDPKGGLTAAGRAYFKRKEGANLKPGVRGPANTPEKMRRKGSFLTRFFTNPSGPMKDENGRATRLALSAAAWGEPVPQDMESAKKLAAKGRRLLERYQKIKEKKSFVTDDIFNKSAFSDDNDVTEDLYGIVEIDGQFINNAPDITAEERAAILKEIVALSSASVKGDVYMRGGDSEMMRMHKASKMMAKRRKKKKARG